MSRSSLRIRIPGTTDWLISRSSNICYSCTPKIASSRATVNKFPQYSEFSIARCLMWKKFQGMLMAIDNTYHAGDEADLLLVTPRLHLIDVEIKISRQDLKADRAKDKWRSVPPYYHHGPRCPEVVREWPRGIWKHYYCVAEPIWQDSLLEFVAPRSGVFTISI